LNNTRYRPQARLFLIVSYALWAAVTIRWITEFREAQHPLTWLVTAILALFGVLVGLEPWITSGSAWRAHVYLAFQTGLVLTAILFHFQLDFFALLFLPLCGQAMFLFPRRIALTWVAILVLATVSGQIHQFGWPGGLSFIFLYTAGLFFVAAFSTLTIRAEDSRQESERLLAELQVAHQQLQAYAGQAEELAVAQERNRLARDLHDSVAQTLYGLTLQAEAASRRLLSGHVDTVADYLSEIRQSAQETLQETRLLIFELQPPVLEQQGLAPAIKARLESVEGRSDLKIQLHLDEVGRLPTGIEVAVYRIAQEALNNIIKHAHASQVQVTLARDDGIVSLEVADDGIGFDPRAVSQQAGMGLKGMRERAAQINGKLRVISEPGRGTQVQLEVPI
jgi:signal transduction histidine kinase